MNASLSLNPSETIERMSRGPSQPLGWLSKDYGIGLKDNCLVRYGWKDKLSLLLNGKKESREIQNIVNFLNKKLVAQHQDKNEWILLSDALIKKCSKNRNVTKIVKIFDREIVKQRHNVAFSHPANQASFKKWQKAGMPDEIYQNHPEFCSFLETTPLLSQMKVTRDTPQEVDGEAALLVDGKLMKWSELKETFKSVRSTRYKETLIVKMATSEVYTYLDNGKGLQLHHPFLTELTPISKLSDADYDTVLKVAHRYVRPNEAELTESERVGLNKNRPFVIQVVSSYVAGSNSNASKLLYQSKHPYLRLIVGQDNPVLKTEKGNVYEVGYGWKEKMSLPLIATEGQFRSPDVWEYKSPKERVVTNIAVSQEEAHAFYSYTQRYFRDSVNLGNPIGFHLVHQNCSTYVRASLEAAGIKVPTEISVDDLLKKIAPDWIQKIGRVFRAAKEVIGRGIDRTLSLLPRGLKSTCGLLAEKVRRRVRNLFRSSVALSLIPLNAALGGGSGTGGTAFSTSKKPKEAIGPELRNWKTWFQLSHYRFNFPGVLQEWQREQASTVITKSPIKFAIVPPAM